MDNDSPATFIQFVFRERFLFLLIVLLGMLILNPILDEFVRLSAILKLLLTAVFIFAIHALSDKRHHILLATALALPMLVSVWFEHFVESPVLVLMGNFCGMAFVAFVVINILVFIYQQQEVTRDLIVGAAVVYLLMGLGWTFLYRALDIINPASFSVPSSAAHRESFHFLYYSFVTLTTLGYGDITPVTSVARSLSILEAIIGQLYLVVQVAWLVGVYVSQSMEKKSQ
jgi:hypothetical protein